MSAPQAENAAPDPTPPEPGSALLFTLGAAALAAGLGILAAQAPARIRLLGLFPLAFGLLTGWCLTRLAARLNIRLNAPRTALVGVATLCGLMISTWQTVARQPAPAAAVPHPIAAAVEAQLKQAGHPAASSTPAPQLGLTDRVRIYLQRRLEMLGEWPSPWPELFWSAEAAAAVAGAMWVAVRFQPKELPS